MRLLVCMLLLSGLFSQERTNTLYLKERFKGQWEILEVSLDEGETWSKYENSASPYLTDKEFHIAANFKVPVVRTLSMDKNKYNTNISFVHILTQDNMVLVCTEIEDEDYFTVSLTSLGEEIVLWKVKVKDEEKDDQ